MRIAILTLPLRLNYGGILQAYALQTVLTRMGHDVKVVYNSPYRNERLFIQIYHALRHIVGKYILRRYKGPILDMKAYNDNYRAISINVQPFIDKYIHKYVSEEGMKINKESDFDAIVVGSDQVWRPCYAGKIERYFLDFARDWNIKRIAYAASFGVDNWEFSKKQTSRCKHLVQRFDAISVREKGGKALCRMSFDVDSMWVLDPTMLLNIKDYNELLNGCYCNYPNMLFCYVLDVNNVCLSLSNFISKEKNLRIKSILRDPNLDQSCLARPSVECWLSFFENASFVFTDSFHGCVFSIIYNKPFVVYSNKSRGEARLKSLLSMFDLENRLVDCVSSVEKVINTPIDWFLVNKKRHEKSLISCDFLTRFLNN